MLNYAIITYMGKLKIDPKARIIFWIVIAISVGLYFLGKQIPEETIQNLVKDAGPWGPLIFILLHSLSIIIAPISGLPFLVSGFYLFGQTTIFYMYFSAVIGYAVNFYIARRWGRSFVVGLIGHDSMTRIDKLVGEYGILTLIFLRLLWAGVADYVSYAYGLTKMRFGIYIIISILASIPGQIFWYYIALKTLTIERFLLVTYMLTFIGAGIFLTGRYLLRKGK